MKYLRYFLYAALVLIALFFLMGLIKPSIEYGHEVTVNKSAKEAWAVLQDQNKYDQWLKGFKSIDLISGEHGKKGSQYKVVVLPGEGQAEIEMIETLEDIKEFEYVDLSFDNDGMVFRQKISLSGTDGNIKVKTESKVTGKGIAMRSVFAIMHTFSDGFQQQEEANIEALKKVINENTTDYYPSPVLEVEES